MARPKSPTRLEAERLCRDFPDTPTRTLAKRLSKSHQITIENARDAVRRIRGNHGNRDRKDVADKSQYRENQPAGFVPETPPPLMPESLAEPWLPFELGNGIRVAVLSDIHVPYHSKTALESTVRHTKRKNPNVLLLNGDFADFYAISRHQKDPSKRDFKQEMQMIREGLSWLRHQYGKECRIVYKLGNHEERWQHYLWNAAPEISDDPRMDIAEWIDAKKHGVEVVGDQRPIFLGELPILHGHELGKGGVAAPVNPARGLWLRTSGTMLIGHGHRTSHHVEPDWRHKQTSCWSTGCLCVLTPEYARINKWNWGAAEVEVNGVGGFEVDNFRLGPDGDVWK